MTTVRDILKVMTVYEFANEQTKERRQYIYRAQAGDYFHEFFVLSPADYIGMGRPEAITVTIQPGDLLNNEPRSDHPELDLG